MADSSGEPLGVNHVMERSVNMVAKLAFFSFILAWILTRAQCQPDILPSFTCSVHMYSAQGFESLHFLRLLVCSWALIKWPGIEKGAPAS